MNKKNILSSISLLIFGILFLPNMASAQTITALAGNLLSIVNVVVSAAVVIFWLVTGFLFLSAQGDPAKLTKAKQALIYSIVGTAVAFLSGTAWLIIKNAILTGA